MPISTARRALSNSPAAAKRPAASRAVSRRRPRVRSIEPIATSRARSNASTGGRISCGIEHELLELLTLPGAVAGIGELEDALDQRDPVRALEVLLGLLHELELTDHGHHVELLLVAVEAVAAGLEGAPAVEARRCLAVAALLEHAREPQDLAASRGGMVETRDRRASAAAPVTRSGEALSIESRRI